jgi:hypothetical protein
MPRTKTVSSKTVSPKSTKSVVAECSNGYGGQHTVSIPYTRPITAWTMRDLQRFLLAAFDRLVPQERRRHPKLFGVRYSIQRQTDSTRMQASYGLGPGHEAAVWIALPAGLPVPLMAELMANQDTLCIQGTVMLRPLARTSGGVR